LPVKKQLSEGLQGKDFSQEKRKKGGTLNLKFKGVKSGERGCVVGACQGRLAPKKKKKKKKMPVGKGKKKKRTTGGNSERKDKKERPAEGGKGGRLLAGKQRLSKQNCFLLMNTKMPEKKK